MKSQGFAFHVQQGVGCISLPEANLYEKCFHSQNPDMVKGLGGVLEIQTPYVDDYLKERKD